MEFGKGCGGMVANAADDNLAEIRASCSRWRTVELCHLLRVCMVESSTLARAADMVEWDLHSHPVEGQGFV